MTQTDQEMLASRIEARADRYVEGTRRPSVALVETVRGWNATIDFFEISRDGRRHSIVAKTFHPRRRQAAGPQPRIFQPSDWPSPGDRERRALERIHMGFSKLGDPRFGSVRVLDHLVDTDTVIMEKHPGQGLDQLIERRSRPCPRRTPALDTTCARTGAWLRAYHELPDMPGTPAVHTSRRDLAEAVEALAIRLDTTSRSNLRASIRGLVENRLPDQLPASTLHGDFVPRNVLVSGEQVVVFDTRAPWLAPREWDLARFLLALKCDMVQALTWGTRRPRALVSELEAALLDGYGSASSRQVVRVFESIGVLEMWALAQYRTRAARGLRRQLKRARLSVIEAFYARQIRAFLQEATR